jgi:hypothetical protein
MTGMQTFMAGTALASTALSAKSAMDQASATQQIANNNAKMAEYAATDAQAKGEEDAQAIQRKAAALKSSQRVGLAAHGLDLGYGTAADLQDQTDFFAQSDAATARTNARGAAWRGTSQAQDFRSQGAAAAYNGNMSAAGSLIGGAGTVADKWYPK